jgi:hypothetical protein
MHQRVAGEKSTMANYAEMSLYVRLFMKKYPFSKFRIEPVPNSPLRKPLSASTVALVTTAGLCPPDQPPFNQKLKMGDPSWREIPNGIETTDREPPQPILRPPRDRGRPELGLSSRPFSGAGGRGEDRPSQPPPLQLYGFDHWTSSTDRPDRARGGATPPRRQGRRRLPHPTLTDV